jgi:hypothetical protein
MSLTRLANAAVVADDWLNAARHLLVLSSAAEQLRRSAIDVASIMLSDLDDESESSSSDSCGAVAPC